MFKWIKSLFRKKEVFTELPELPVQFIQNNEVYFEIGRARRDFTCIDCLKDFKMGQFYAWIDKEDKPSAKFGHVCYRCMREKMRPLRSITKLLSKYGEENKKQQPYVDLLFSDVLDKHDVLERL